MRARLPVFLLSAALAFTLFWRIRTASDPFTYPAGFVSADVALAARNFANFGVIAMRAVPVNNNPPVGPHDAYVHWPPLAPILVSLVFRIFGDSPVAAHALMLAIQLATLALVMLIARDWLEPGAGLLAGFFWLTMPVVVHFSNVVAQQSFCIWFFLISIWSLRRSRWGAIAALLAAWSAWEAVMLIPAFFALAGLGACPRKRAWLYSGAILAGMASVLALYGWQHPDLFADAMQTLRFRMGLDPSYSHRLLHHSPEQALSISQTIRLVLWNHFRMLGVLALASLVSLVLARPKGWAATVCSLGAPWLVWTVLVPNHVAKHAFELLLAAPLAAIALAWSARNAAEKNAVAFLVFAAIAAVQPWILGTGIQTDITPPELIRFGEAMREATPAGSVILSPLSEIMPIWLSERHVVRNIADETMLRDVVHNLRADFPQAPFFLVIPPRMMDDFDRRPLVSRSAGVIVMKLD
jgi:hypothetical protein